MISHQTSAAIACKTGCGSFKWIKKYLGQKGSESQNSHLIVNGEVREQAHTNAVNILAGLYRTLSLLHNIQLCSIAIDVSIVHVRRPTQRLQKSSLLDSFLFYWIHKSITWKYVYLFHCCAVRI